MKFLYLPNEIDATNLACRQVGPRKAFQRLHDEGTITEFKIFSFLHEARLKGSEAAKREILEITQNMRPDAIFWQHANGFPIDKPFVEQLRRLMTTSVIAYHDEDPYGATVKTIPQATRNLLPYCDLVLISGLGYLSDLYRKYGSKNIKYIPHYYDGVRFGSEWLPPHTRNAQISMIANCGRRRIPGIYVPGGRRRAKLAKQLSKKFGRDFALYGAGWSGLNSARGHLPFVEQGTAIRDSWVSVNWDHFDDIPFYFSDRLPISLAAGVVHVTSYHSGYDEILGDCPGLYWAKSIDEMLGRIDWILGRSRRDLIEEGLAAKHWVLEHLEADIVFKRAFDLVAQTVRAIKTT